jgi:hypothetical protein
MSIHRKSRVPAPLTALVTAVSRALPEVTYFTAVARSVEANDRSTLKRANHTGICSIRGKQAAGLTRARSCTAPSSPPAGLTVVLQLARCTRLISGWISCIAFIGGLLERQEQEDPDDDRQQDDRYAKIWMRL